MSPDSVSLTVTDSVVRTSVLDYAVTAIINRHSIRYMIYMTLNEHDSVMNEYDSVTWYWKNMTVLHGLERI